MRKIWKAEREFVEQIVSVLKDIDSQYPTDVFYFDILAVPPPNVRPVSNLLFFNLFNFETY